MSDLLAALLWLCGFGCGAFLMWCWMDIRETERLMRKDDERWAEYEAGVR